MHPSLRSLPSSASRPSRPSRRILPSLVLLAAATALLSGCFGPDDVGRGQAMVVTYNVYDDEGSLLLGPLASPAFVPGSGNSTLGPAAEDALATRGAGDDFEATVQPRPGQEVRVPTAVPPGSARLGVPVQDITAETGMAADEIVPGATFEVGPPSARERYLVVARDNGNATIEIQLRDDVDGREVTPYPMYGIEVHNWVEQGLIHTELVPMEGAIIIVPHRAPTGEALNPFQLPEGIYRVVGAEGGELILQGRTLPEAIAGPVRIEGTVVQVAPPPTTTAQPDGHFGNRESPRLK